MQVTTEFQVATPAAFAIGSVAITPTLVASDLVVVVYSRSSNNIKPLPSINGVPMTQYGEWVNSAYYVKVLTMSGLTGSHSVSYEMTNATANVLGIYVIHGLSNPTVTANSQSTWDSTQSPVGTTEVTGLLPVAHGQVALGVCVVAQTGGSIQFPVSQSPTGWKGDYTGNNGWLVQLAHRDITANGDAQVGVTWATGAASAAMAVLMLVVGDPTPPTYGTRYQNTFETGLATGTALTTANSDGTAGDALTVVDTSGSSNVVVSTTTPATETRCARLTISGLSGLLTIALGAEPTPQRVFAYKFYYKHVADFGAQLSLIFLRTPADASVMSIQVRSSNHTFETLDTDGLNIGTFTPTLTFTVGTWYRFEGWVMPGYNSQTGRSVVHIYDADGVTPLTTNTRTTSNYGTVPAGKILIGRTGGTLGGTVDIDTITVQSRSAEGFIEDPSTGFSGWGRPI